MGNIMCVADVNSGTNLSGALVFETAAAGVPTPKLRITSGGMVLIGESSVAGGSQQLVVGNGGAENTLYKICKYDNFNNHFVISLKKSGKYYQLLRKLGVKVYCLDFKIYSIIKFIHLIKLLRYLKPDVVQTWLVHGDFIGGIAARFAGLKNIIWNVRYSNLKFGKAKLITILKYVFEGNENEALKLLKELISLILLTE